MPKGLLVIAMHRSGVFARLEALRSPAMSGPGAHPDRPARLTSPTTHLPVTA